MLKKIMDTLVKRHKHYISRTGIKISTDANKLFEKEENKFILIILNELNKFLLPENKIYGYTNELDQKEFALVGRKDLIDLSSIKVSKYTKIIKKNNNKVVTFPITYNNYYTEFNREYITLYTSYSKYIEDKYKNNPNDIKELKTCMRNWGIEINSLRMFKTDNTQIFYEDFDDGKEKEFKNLILDDYWRKKYLKYKTKYITIKNQLYNK